MKMDEKIAALDADVNALKKDAATLESMRSGQANTTADMSELKESIQQLRGQVETLKKDSTATAKKDDQRFDNMLLKINFIENFLDIGSKHNSSDASDKNGKSTAAPLPKILQKNWTRKKLIPMLIRYLKKEITIKPEQSFRIFY